MQWNSDRNAGFSRVESARLYAPVIDDPVFGYRSINVEAESKIQTSLLNWMRRLIRIRKQYPVFGRGSVTFLYPHNVKVLAFIRSLGDQHILCVNNLSRFSQPVELNLSAYNGRTPVELYGETRFPPIGELPYFITLGPHSFYWFRLDQ
jgi:maltose alpha-D-glucosyltransferase/alpha-amylase